MKIKDLIIGYFILIPLSYWPNIILFNYSNFPNLKYVVAILLGVFYIVFNYYKQKSLKLNLIIFKNVVVQIFIIGYLSEILLYYFRVYEQIHLLNIILYLLTFLLFYLFLTLQIDSNKTKIQNLKAVLKPYFYISIANISLVIMVAVLIFFELLAPENWPIPKYFGYEFSNRIGNDFFGNIDDYYLAPLNLVVIQPHYLKVDNAFLNSIGAMCGFFYEPHVACFFVTPAFFMIDVFIKKFKIVIYFLFLVFLLLTLSVTNLISFSLVLMIWYIFTKKVALQYKVSFSLIILFIGSFFLQDILFLKDIISLIEYKFTSSSNETSSGYLSYIFSAKSIVGNGFLTIPTVGDSLKMAEVEVLGDIGLIGFLVIIFTYLFLFYYSFRLILNNSGFGFIGYSSLYFLFHSFKIPFFIFRYPFFGFIVFLLIFANFYHGKYEK